MKREAVLKFSLIACSVAAIALVLLVLKSAYGHRIEWQMIQDRPYGEFDFRELTVRVNGNRFTVDCVSSLRKTTVIELNDVQNLDGPQLVQAQRGMRGVVINGGYFDSAFRPVGLFRLDGVERNPLSHQPLLNAVIVSDDAGNVALVHPSAAGIGQARFARQCGPMLIGSDDRPGNWDRAAERTAIVVGASRVALLKTSPCRLTDLQYLLQHAPDALGIPDVQAAANLDGGPSSGMLVYDNGEVVSRSEPRGRITDAVTCFSK